MKIITGIWVIIWTIPVLAIYLLLIGVACIAYGTASAKRVMLGVYEGLK